MGRLIELEGTSGEEMTPLSGPFRPCGAGTVAPAVAVRRLLCPAASPLSVTPTLYPPQVLPAVLQYCISPVGMWICDTDRQILVLSPYISVSRLCTT